MREQSRRIHPLGLGRYSDIDRLNLGLGKICEAQTTKDPVFELIPNQFHAGERIGAACDFFNAVCRRVGRFSLL